MMAAGGGPGGTIIFSTVGRTQYGFDIFSVNIPLHLTTTTTNAPDDGLLESRLTDGVSINFNAQFVQHGGGGDGLVFVSERSGSPRLYLAPPPGGGIFNHSILLLPSPPESLFLDRPIIKNQRLYFISAHHDPLLPFHSWSALYSTHLPPPLAPPLDDDDDANNNNSNSKLVRRLTPYGSVDYSPSISQSGNLIAVASYGSRPWQGEFHQLNTDIVVFPDSHPTHRTLVCQHGGWPTWSGDSTIYFHRQADDGWWSIFTIDYFQPTTTAAAFTPPTPRRVTPPGHHCFTPAAMHNGKHIAVATRRPGNKFRHIEIFDVLSQTFYPVTQLLNPNCHHYNPFVSPDSGSLGYHRFRGGGGGGGDLVIPHLESVASPVKGLNMLRLNGSFPCFSPDGDLIAFNHSLDGSDSGVKILKSDGSRRYSLLKGRTAFCNSWSPREKNVIFTSLGPIFESVKATVQIARISFRPEDLLSGDSEEQVPVAAAAVDVKILTKEDTGNNAFPSCSPDGKFVVFRSGRSGHKNLYIVDAVNGELGGIRQLTTGACIDTMPSWSPDGKLIAFSSNRHNPDNVAAFSIYVIHPDGTGLRRIPVAGGDEEINNRERINHVCFSADGEWLLFTANLGGVIAEPVSLPNQFQPYGDLYVIKLDGTRLQRLTWNGYENGTPTWHPEVSSLNSEGGGQQGGLVGGDKLKGEFDEPLWIH